MAGEGQRGCGHEDAAIGQRRVIQRKQSERIYPRSEALLAVVRDAHVVAIVGDACSGWG